MESFILDQKKTGIQQEAYEEWTERFPYTVDYALLQITLDAGAEDAIISE